MKNKSLLSRLTLSVCIFTIALSGCSFPAASASSDQEVAQVASTDSFTATPNLATVDPNATATPTPFMPVDATATIMPTEIATPDPELAGIEVTTDSYAGRLTEPEGTVNILIFGSDYRPMKGYRTDVIMLLSLNTINGTATVTSFPRDLYVYIPGWEMNRINTAQAHGGFETTVATFEYNFGVTPDYYVMTNFDGFKSMIDSLGGIDVEVEKYLSDKCDLPQSSYKYCSVDVGTTHMDGDTALWYVRSRYSTSDFDRLRRAQEVIQGIFTKILSLDGLSRASELYDLYKSSVETNMTATDILSLLPTAAKLTDTSSITRYAVSQDYVTPYMTEGGASVQIPDQQKIWDEIITKAVYGQ